MRQFVVSTLRYGRWSRCERVLNQNFKVVETDRGDLAPSSEAGSRALGALAKRPRRRTYVIGLVSLGVGHLAVLPLNN